MFELRVFCLRPLLVLPPRSVRLRSCTACTMLFSLCFACVLVGARLHLSAHHHFTTASLFVCLSLSCMSLSYSLWSLLLHPYIAFPTAIQSRSSRVSSFSDFASFILCLCAIESSPVTAFLFGDSVGVQCGLKCAALSCFYFVFWFVNFWSSIYEFTCVFCVNFELHLRSVLSCMCMVVSRPQWRTS